MNIQAYRTSRGGKEKEFLLPRWRKDAGTTGWRWIRPSSDVKQAPCRIPTGMKPLAARSLARDSFQTRRHSTDLALKLLVFPISIVLPKPTRARFRRSASTGEQLLCPSPGATTGLRRWLRRTPGSDGVRRSAATAVRRTTIRGSSGWIWDATGIRRTSPGLSSAATACKSSPLVPRVHRVRS